MAKVEIKLNENQIAVNKKEYLALTSQKIKEIIRDSAPHNYHQFRDWVIVEALPGTCHLYAKKTEHGIDKGKMVLDFHAMYSAANMGHANPEITSHIICFLKKNGLVLSRHNDHPYHAPALDAIKTFTGMDMVTLKSTGAEAVETASNIAMRYFWDTQQKIPEKHGRRLWGYFISMENNFHGRTRWARALSTSTISQEGFITAIDKNKIQTVPFGNAHMLEDKLKELRDEVAAVILEPIQCEGGGEKGIIIPPQGYLKRVRELCSQYKVVLIFDEIQTAFGRVGADLVYEEEGIKPDMVCLGKALGGGMGIPVSCVAGKKEVMECLNPGHDGATHSATPIQCLAALGALKFHSEHDLSRHAREKGVYFYEKLKRVREEYPHLIRDIRWKGLLFGIDALLPAKEMSYLLFNEGIYCGEAGRNTLRLSPPLIIGYSGLDMGAQALKCVMEKLNAVYGNKRE